MQAVNAANKAEVDLIHALLINRYSPNDWSYLIYFLSYRIDL